MNDQLASLFQRFESIESDDAHESPQMPFITSYSLTREQEDNLVTHARKRLQELEGELGRDTVASGDWWSQGVEVADAEGREDPQRTFMGKRRLYELRAQNNITWRPKVIGGIYLQSNLTLPVTRPISNKMTARANNYFFGSDPFFAVYPVGAQDRELAVKANKYTQYKAEESNLRSTLESAVDIAFDLGEAVIKSTHTTLEQPYQRIETVLVNGLGDPVFAQDQDYITQDDTWSDQNGTMVLNRDGATPLPDQHEYKEMLINRRSRINHGPNQQVIHFQDFLCPLKARDVQTADCVIHLYDTAIMDLADTWAKRGVLELNPNEANEVTIKAVAALKAMSTSGADESRRNKFGEASKVGIDSSAIVQIAEFYLRYDANGDGIMEEIMLLIDRNSGTPIFYDHVANVTPDGKRPFSVIRVNKSHGFWHGIGAIEMFESSQDIIDLFINRWNFSQSSSARVDFWNPEATLEGQSNPYLKLNQGKTYTLRPGKNAEDALQSVVLSDIKSDNIHEQIQIFMQLVTNESGVAHANDSSLAGLDSSKLATGIRNIEKSSQEQFSTFLSDLEPGIEDVINKFKNLLFYYIDPEEVVEIFDHESREITDLQASDITDLDMHIQLSMTRQHGQQVLESSMQASDIIEKFYSYPPVVQSRVAALYIDSLRALNVKSPEELIVPLEQAELPPQSGGASPQQLAQTVAPKDRQSTPNL